jgi:hypothetical protein
MAPQLLRKQYDFEINTVQAEQTRGPASAVGDRTRSDGALRLDTGFHIPNHLENPSFVKTA